MDLSLLLALLSGVAIAAACGLRAFLPLFLLGAAARGGWISLAPGGQWLASNQALVALGVATVLELLGDKIPVVDHALDAVGTVVRPAAAWVGAYALLVHWPTPLAQLAAIVLGSSALAIHALKAKLRIGSTAVTLGAGNPLLSFLEDFFALAGTVVAILAPVLAIAIPALVIWAIRRRRRAPPQPAMPRASAPPA